MNELGLGVGIEDLNGTFPGPLTLAPSALVENNGGMWIDQRGSEVLPVAECRRLLAVGAKRHHHGHLGVPTDGAPLVLPFDYAVHGVDVLIQIGEGLFDQVNGRLVAFQVDHSPDGTQGSDTDTGSQWSVLVRGLAGELDQTVGRDHLPQPRVAQPGHRLVQVRGDIVTGRRLQSSHPGPNFVA